MESLIVDKFRKQGIPTSLSEVFKDYGSDKRAGCQNPFGHMRALHNFFLFFLSLAVYIG